MSDESRRVPIRDGNEPADDRIPAAMYVRMSTEHQQYSTENQADAIRQYADRQGFRIVETFADEGKSGLSIEGRDSLRRLIDTVSSRRAAFKAILVYDISRWGRFQDVDESASYEYTCRRAGIAVHYCAEQFANDGTPTSAIIKAVKRAMAGEYSRELSTKVFAGQCRLVQMGYRQGGMAGFGLRRMLLDMTGAPKGTLRHGEQKSLQTDRVVLVPGPDEEVATVRWIYQAFVDEGRRERDIADTLNARGLPTDLGRPWTCGTVRQVLSNEKYIGNNVFNRHSFKLKQRHRANPPEEWVRKDGAFEGIVDPETFSQAQAILQERAKRFTDEELLDRLRALHQRHGRVSGILIDEDDGLPGASAYQSRFGGLLRAYRLIGYTPDIDYSFLEVNRRLRERHPAIVAEVVGQLRTQGGSVEQDADHGLFQLVELAGEVFSDQDSDFVCKITGRVDRPLQRIREFRNRAKPGIAVTVDLLSTGVDIPDLECIVLLRPLKSRILFEQILGRGTRRGERFPDKSHFTVFDCFDGTILEYFRNATAISEGPLGGVARSNAEIIEAIWRNQERDYNVRCLVRRLNRVAKEMSGDAFALFKAHIPDGDVAGFAKGLPDRIRTDFQATMAILRNPDFQKLLLDYPRPPRTFVIAYPVEDEVSTRWMIRDGAGAEYLPEDYLAAFARFVKDHASDIDAIAILLDRPRDWGIDALRQLRDQLAGTKERFTPDNLRRAHEAQYHKALVDIISMVKHAARADSPLLTAEERVERAFIQVTADRTFTPEQWQWLERIRGHLVENLSVAPSDFDVVPVFERYGGWNRADRAFDGALGDLLKSFNEAIAA